MLSYAMFLDMTIYQSGINKPKDVKSMNSP